MSESRPLRRWRVRLIRLAIVAFVLFAILNGLCYRHAVSFTQYVASGPKPPKPESLSLSQKFWMGITGVPVPRPENTSTPAKWQLPYETISIPIGEEMIEAWFIDHPAARGTVVMRRVEA